MPQGVTCASAGWQGKSDLAFLMWAYLSGGEGLPVRQASAPGISRGGVETALEGERWSALFERFVLLVWSMQQNPLSKLTGLTVTIV